MHKEKDYPRIVSLLNKSMGFNLNIVADFKNIKAAIVRAHPSAEFMNGECMLFHLELRRAFPDAVPIITNDHVVTLIDGSLWDFTGCVGFSPNQETGLFTNALNRTEEFLSCNLQKQS